jgi:hypothetical protein
MKKLTKSILVLAVFAVMANIIFSACKKDFLEVTPTASATESVLGSKKGLDGLLIGCYSVLTGRDILFFSGFGNWVHGSILGGEANKGTNGGDQAVVNPVQRFETLPNNDLPSQKWNMCYEGVSRCNQVLRVLNNTTDPTVTDADKTRIRGEARFLRGFYYFELRRLFGKVPFVDENMAPDEATKVRNDVDIYGSIEADFQFAIDNLPETQPAVGRANSWAAKAFLAKVHLYQQHYAEAKSLFDDIIANGKNAGGLKYSLTSSYPDIFKPEFENNGESIFAVQAAVNTGSTANANGEHVLNFPYNSGSDGPAGCCGFFQPSFDLANSFRTNDNGLPLLDGSYNNATNELKNDFGVKSADPFSPDAGTVDPRLDHSVGRRGIPYLDWINHPGDNWIRDQAYAGPYSPKKFVFYKGTLSTFTDGSSWTRGWTAINQPLMRYADVLLMAAECEIEVGSVDKARDYVNQVRARAANPASYVKKLTDGSNAANYTIGLYNTPWSDKDAARTAVRMERKLELSGEGHRFFDLVRWGIADQVLDAYLQYEGGKLPTSLGGAQFTAGKTEVYPIPQSQIDIQGTDVLKQNPGY